VILAVRSEQDDYVIDVFATAIESPDNAHLTAHTCDTWQQVLAFCTHYDDLSVF
jgi:hypothetical protein